MLTEEILKANNWPDSYANSVERVLYLLERHDEIESAAWRSPPRCRSSTRPELAPFGIVSCTRPGRRPLVRVFTQQTAKPRF
jgi:hypothetical protein